MQGIPTTREVRLRKNRFENHDFLLRPFKIDLQKDDQIRYHEKYNSKIYVVFSIAQLAHPVSEIFAQTSSTGFKKHVISNDFISEGVAVGDVNNDGKIDILAGPSWFEAPAWKRHDIDTVKTIWSKTEYSRSFLNHAMDINQDGWPDLIVVDFPGLSADWFENPGKKAGYWKKHRLYDNVGNEHRHLLTWMATARMISFARIQKPTR